MNAAIASPCWGLKALVNHLVASNLPDILSKSRMHCHARNVHSVMLLEAPGKTIRLFVADVDHDLHKNHPVVFSEGMSVGFHTHHCDITIVSVQGELLNWNVKPVADGRLIAGYAYKSALRGEKPGFEILGSARLGTDRLSRIGPGQSLFLYAETLHTIAVESGKIAAWLVFEGRESENYSPVCYSTSDLERADLTGLYQPMSETELLRLLGESRLI